MELVLRGEVALVQGEALEGEQAEGRAEWEARDPAPAPLENACVRVVEILLPIRRDYPATSGAVLSAVH
jgi:hypothetical protein